MTLRVEPRVPLQLSYAVLGRPSNIAYDTERNEAVLFQLKWQHNAVVDTRARRSAARNLITEGARWIRSVGDWLDRHGVHELGQRAGLAFRPGIHVEMFVLARYEAGFPGVLEKDERATWADWAHLLRTLWDVRRSSPKEIAQRLRADASRAQTSHEDESFFMPLGDLTIAFNPPVEPWERC
ncbi:hypothetical protein QRQ56_31285 [Bradyrhizobium sp. U531]|uniref:hypothetical protein n=1 Tax=Bradyrhizobium sp. U531 TaxID=3053458 RepID=UPI003F42395C